MFVLLEIKQKISINPNQSGVLEKSIGKCVTKQLNNRYSGKILPKYGWCVGVYDVSHVSDPLIMHGTGSQLVDTVFRLIVFKPFVGEVLLGTVVDCDLEKGIRITMDFFSDIWIPPFLMQEDRFFDLKEKLWVWRYQENNMYFDKNEKIRFKVTGVEFDPKLSEDSNEPPNPMDGKINLVMNAQLSEKDKEKFKAQQGSSAEANQAKEKELPMIIKGRINEDGLGLVSWWE